MQPVRQLPVADEGVPLAAGMVRLHIALVHVHIGQQRQRLVRGQLRRAERAAVQLHLVLAEPLRPRRRAQARALFGNAKALRLLPVEQHHDVEEIPVHALALQQRPLVRMADAQADAHFVLPGREREERERQARKVQLRLIVGRLVRIAGARRVPVDGAQADRAQQRLRHGAALQRLRHLKGGARGRVLRRPLRRGGRLRFRRAGRLPRAVLRGRGQGGGRLRRAVLQGRVGGRLRRAGRLPRAVLRAAGAGAQRERQRGKPCRPSSFHVVSPSRIGRCAARGRGPAAAVSMIADDSL